MALQWKRWFRYAKAEVDRLGRKANKEMDRREAELEAERADRPWVRDDDDTPTLDDVRARIEHDRRRSGGPDGDEPPGPPPPKSSGDPAFDLAAQQKAADERLASIRESLGLDAEPPADGT